MKHISDVFDSHFKNLKVNDGFIKEINEYLNGIFTKNEDAVKFFGSVLIGVYPVYFDRGDRNYLWDIIVEADIDEIKGDLHSVPYINPSWLVGGDATNHLIIYLIHRVIIANNLSNRLQEATILNLLVLLQYKFITTFLHNDYPYVVNKELAMTVYNRLSKRFILRQVDSWKELFYTRARTMLDGTDNRKDMYTIIREYKDDKLIVNTITGISTNLRGMMNDYNAMFHAIKDEPNRISLDSRLGVNNEGEAVFKDNLTNPIKYHNYLESNINKEDTFINDDLVTTIASAGKSRYKPVRRTLVYLTQQYGQPRQDDLQEFVDNALQFGLTKIKENNKDMRNIREVFECLTGSFSSSRSMDPTLERLKQLGQNIIDRALGKKTHNNTMTLTRTIVMTYIVIWVLLTSG